jgi:hypothetical protein
LGFTLNGIRQRNPYSSANGLLYDARRVLPITTPYNDALGVYSELAIQNAQISNPLMNLENKWDKELRYENRMVASVFFDWNFLEKFQLENYIVWRHERPEQPWLQSHHLYIQP